MPHRDALAAAHARIAALERSIRELEESNLRLREELDLRARQAEALPPRAVDPVKERYDVVLESARGRLDAHVMSTLREMVREHGQHGLTLELLDRIRCSRCADAIDAARRTDVVSDETFWRGLCPTCNERWTLLP